MQKGRVGETASAVTIFKAPEHPYTRKLMRATPRPGAGLRDLLPDAVRPLDPPPCPARAEPLLVVRGLVKEYPRKGATRTPSRLFRRREAATGRFRAVDGIGFDASARSVRSAAASIPDVVAEVEAAFATYEKALVTNDLTIRYGVAENLYGMDEIRAFRRARSPIGVARTLERTVITTFRRDFATAHTLFWREAATGRIGRQSQTWVRFPEGWRVVSAHVSLIPE